LVAEVHDKDSGENCGHGVECGQHCVSSCGGHGAVFVPAGIGDEAEDEPDWGEEQRGGDGVRSGRHGLWVRLLDGSAAAEAGVVLRINRYRR
jgi:hypothetical protein